VLEPAIPDPLPARLLTDLASRRALFVGLDLDGTLSEIVSEPSQAVALPGVPGLLKKLASAGERVAVAVLSGRELTELRRILGVERGLMGSGVHGLELMDRDGATEISLDARVAEADLQKVRVWLRSNVPGGAGFVIEDKKLSIALHYRKVRVELAREVCDKFRAFIAREAPALKSGEGKMVVEALPRSAGKGKALMALWERAGKFRIPVYFGDDLTDEDAFEALGDEGITILVGERPSRARYRVDGPSEVVRELEKIAAVFDRRVP
jgi:trehalose-phosphatase